MPLLGTILAVVLLASTSWAAGLEAYGTNLGSLISPSKLATLGRHGANQRVQKAVHLLELAQRDRLAPALVIDEALRRVSLTGQVARLTKEALLRNHHIARTNGCLDEAGMWEMAHGKAPTIQSGPSRGDELSVDHVRAILTHHVRVHGFEVRAHVAMVLILHRRSWLSLLYKLT